jgi:hypothetical protein
MTGYAHRGLPPQVIAHLPTESVLSATENLLEVYRELPALFRVLDFLVKIFRNHFSSGMPATL